MWDAQGGVLADGYYPLQLNTAYSIELNNATYIEELGKEIRIMLEEEAFFYESGVWYCSSPLINWTRLQIENYTNFVKYENKTNL